MNARGLLSIIGILLPTLLASCANLTTGRLSSIDVALTFHHDSIANVTYTIRENATIEKVMEVPDRWWWKRTASVRHLTTEGWQQFEAELAHLQVRKWRHRYCKLTLDGYMWGLEMTEAGRDYHSSGINAGPMVSNPNRTGSIWNEPTVITADVKLDRALNSLWRASR